MRGLFHMNILYVLPYFNPKNGGDVNVCANIAKQFVKRGHEVTILTTDFEIDVDEAIFQKKTLKIILQPLVENAIYHGIKNKAEVGIVKIKGRRIEDKILLQIIDNGAGMTPEEIDTIFIKKEASLTKGSGVGVRNVNDRIKLYFGDAYGLSYESEMDKGTTANIWLPVMDQICF